MGSFTPKVNIPAPANNLPAPRGRSSWRAPLVLLAAIVTAVSGCSSTETSQREAEYLGTRICITNYYLDGVNVTYTELDADASRKDPFYFEGDLPIDTESCAVASGGLPVKSVSGNLVVESADLSFTFEARNDFLQPPTASLVDNRSGGICINDGWGYDVGETQLWDNGQVRISITRLDDDQYKEFAINLESSQGQRVGNDPC